MLPVHPDDVLLFTEVSKAMRVVARKYELPLRNIEGYPMPKDGMADCMGDCNGRDIRIVLRCTENGEWCEEPISPEEVYKTAAHELAHLRYLNHGSDFQDLLEELEFAMENQRVDHRQKIINKLVKLQKSKESESAIGNAEAAEAFAAMINKMLIENELQPSDIVYARTNDNDPVVEIQANLTHYGIRSQKIRNAWQETLAQGVAKAHLCQILVNAHSNNIWFVGTRSHATVAEYVYGTMVPLVDKMSKKAEVDYWKETGCGRGRDNQAKGYRSAWIGAFITRIWQRFEEARKQAIDEAREQGTSSETALVRLDGALIKVRKYIEDKFVTSRRAARALNALSVRVTAHEAGRAAGRAAADSIVLGRRGITGNRVKLIGE